MVAVLGALALGWFPQGPLRGLLESRLQALVGPGSRIGKLRVMPGRLEAEILGLVLDSSLYRFEADRVDIKLSRETFFKDGLFLDRLEMKSGQLTLRTPANQPPPSAPSSAPIVIRHIDISGITLESADSGLRGGVVLRSLSLRGSVGEGVLDVTAAGGVWQHETPVRLGPIRASLRISNRLDLHLESLDLGLVRTRVQARGALGSAFDPEPDLRFESRIDLAEIAALAGIAPADGILEASGRLFGPIDALAIEAELSGDRLRVSGWPLDRLRGDVKHEAAAGSSTANVVVGLLGGDGRLEGRLEGDAAHGTLTASGLDLGRLLAQLGAESPPGVTGAASATLRFDGDPARRLTVVAEANASGRYGEGTRFRAQAQARGPVLLPAPNLDLAWTMALDTDPDSTSGVPPGRLTAKGTARGALPPAIDATVDGTLALEAPTGPVTVAGRVRSQGDRATADVRLTGLGGIADGSAEMRGSRVVTLEMTGRDIDVGRLGQEAHGTAEFQMKASGPLDALSGTGRVRVGSLSFREAKLGALQADIEATRGSVQVRAELPLLGASSEARIVPANRGKEQTLQGTLALKETPLGVLAPFMGEGQPLEGTLTGTATFDAPLMDPVKGSFDGRIEVLEAVRGDLTARATAPFTFGFANGRGRVDGLRLKGNGLEAHVDGTAGIAEGDPIDVSVKVDADLALLPAPAPWTLAGRAQAEVRVDGTRTAPRAHGFVSLDQAALESPTTPVIRVAAGRLELEGDAIRVPGLTATVASGSVKVEGRAPVASFWPQARRSSVGLLPQEEARLAISWSGVEAGALLTQLSPQQGATVEAALSGQAEIKGGLASLAELRGMLTLPATMARVKDLALELAPAEVRLESSRLSTEGLEIRGDVGTFRMAGSIDLVSRLIDASGEGTLDLRSLSPFLEAAALTGTSVVDVRVRGTLDAPQPEGTVRVTDGSLRLRELRQAITGLSADVVLDASSFRLQNASAAFGGGTLKASGSARFQGAGLKDANFALTGRGLALRYPEGMRTRLETDLTLRGGTGAFRLAGTVRALRGLYDLDAAFEESIKAPPAESADSPLLRSVALDILVTTESPVLVRNNLAQLQATGRLTVRGDLQSPAPIGALDIASGGKIYLQGREFLIGSGRLVYSGTWDPEISLDAVARIKDLDRETGNTRADVNVTVGLEGRLSAPRFSLRSDPAYSQLEIVNLIAAGDSQNPSARLAMGGSAATLLAGRLTRSLGGLGLDQVSIQPELVTREGAVETGARFTFGKRLSPRVNLIYSLSLQDPEGRFIQVEVSPGHAVALSVRRTDAGSFTYGAGQRFRFGGAGSRAEATDERVRVTEVRLEGDLPKDPDSLRTKVNTDPGDRKTVWDLQDDADRLREHLVESGYLEAEVSARFEDQAAVFDVHSGNQYRWRVSGMDNPPDLTRTIRSALFEEEALDLGRALLLTELRQRGYLRAAIEATAVSGDTRTLLFEVQTGPVLQAEVTFPGAVALSTSRLLKAAGGAGRLLTDPGASLRDIRAAYRDALYLGAEIDEPRVLDGMRVAIVVNVREGPRARVDAVRFEGSTLADPDLMRVAGLETGVSYEPDQVIAAVDELRGHYFGLGYASVRVNPRVDAVGAHVELVFEVTEGERVTVAAVVLQGLRHARESLVRRQVRLAPGDPLDPRKVAELERRLLDLGLFTRASATVSEDNPATVTVTLEEGERLRAGYLLSYNDERGTRAELDGELRKLLGAGISLGARLSAGPDIRDARVALSVPPLLLPTGRVTLSVFKLHEDLPLVSGGETLDTFERTQSGGQIQGTRPIGTLGNVLYGYRLKKVSVTSEFLNSSHRVAGIDLSFLRDTRDSPVDARRGRFLSVSLEISPRALGSDFNFVKGFAQAFLTRPLSDSLTWAQGYRLGLAHAFGGEPLVGDEGFEAGGANSIRGFDSGEVGREDSFFGQQAVVVLNQELRYHHSSGFGGALFYDAGNTFATVSEMSFRLRHVLGAGLRWNSPVGLLRMDFGTPLFPRKGEARYKIFFSLGQAF